METLEQTIMQVERFIRKVAQKFPAPESDDETSQMTDIHVRVSQDSGELLAFDDDDNEITRCVTLIPLFRLTVYAVPYYDDYNFGRFARAAMEQEG